VFWDFEFCNFIAKKPSEVANGSLAIQVRSDLFVIPEMALEIWQRVRGILPEQGEVAGINVPPDEVPVSEDMYREFLSELEKFDPAYRQVVEALPRRGFDLWQNVWRPGHILLNAGLLEPEARAHGFLAHEIYERHLHSGPTAICEPLQRIYQALWEIPAFRDFLREHLGAYGKELETSAFWAEFWTWMAWPAFRQADYAEKFHARALTYIGTLGKNNTAFQSIVTEALNIRESLILESDHEAREMIAEVMAALRSHRESRLRRSRPPGFTANPDEEAKSSQRHAIPPGVRRVADRWTKADRNYFEKLLEQHGGSLNDLARECDIPLHPKRFTSFSPVISA
jgi:hypothetical protein